MVLPSFSLDHRAMGHALEPVFGRDSMWERWYVDLPGTGRSPAGEPRSDAVLDQVVASLDDQLGHDSFTVVGWSYGAYLTAGLIRRRTTQIRGAMMICAGLKIRPVDRDLTGVLDSSPEDNWLAHVPAHLHDHLRHTVGNQTVEVGTRTAIAIGDNGPTDEAYLAALRGDGFPLSDEAAPTKLDTPVCLVTGRRDRIAGYRDPLQGLPHLPQADYTALAHAGHYLPLEEPEAFAALVHAWLGRCRR